MSHKLCAKKSNHIVIGPLETSKFKQRLPKSKKEQSQRLIEKNSNEFELVVSAIGISPSPSIF